MVNYKVLFILGLALVIPPFSLTLRGYLFYYSTLGYGLMLISFFFKDTDAMDVIVIFMLALSIITSLLNAFEMYNFLIYFLFFILSIKIIIRFHSVLSQVFALIIMVLFPFSIVYNTLFLIGINLPTIAFDILRFVYPIIILIAYFAENKYSAEVSGADQKMLKRVNNSHQGSK